MPALSKQGRSGCPHLRASQGCCARCGGGGAWGAKIDLNSCYWSVHLPPAMAEAVRVAAAGTTYALVRVPFGWHQAPGLVQHLIAAVLFELANTQVVIVQYLDDILFVGRDRLITGGGPEVPTGAPTVRDAWEALQHVRRLTHTDSGSSTGATAIRVMEPGSVDTYTSALRQALLASTRDELLVDAVERRLNALAAKRKSGSSATAPRWRVTRRRIWPVKVSLSAQSQSSMPPSHLRGWGSSSV